MKIVKWIPQVLLIIAYTMAGLMKLFTPYDQISVTQGMDWTKDFTPMMTKIIGLLEFLGALGLFLPVVLKRNLNLVPLAAAGLALTMVGAMITHDGRGEMEALPPNVVLLLLSLLVIYIRKDFLKKSAA